jgi:secreted trypsin-like serine protease
MVFTDSKQWELVGITSYGYGCATENPGVYTRITAFLTWIQQIVNNTSSQMSAMKYICNRNDPCGCSRRPVKTGRIIGGETALHDSWSWTISIQIGNKHVCGGSILNERYIITAATCTIKINNLSSISVCAGTNRLSGTCGQRHEIQNIINHPSYDSKTYENDIALIQVKVPFDFTDKSIARICLPNTTPSDQYPETGTDVIAVGWGKKEAGQQPDTLQQVTIQVVDEFTDNCNDILKNRLVQLCAGAPGKGKTLLFNRCFSFVSSLLLSCRHLCR